MELANADSLIGNYRYLNYLNHKSCILSSICMPNMQVFPPKKSFWMKSGKFVVGIPGALDAAPLVDNGHYHSLESRPTGQHWVLTPLGVQPHWLTLGVNYPWSSAPLVDIGC